LSEYILNYLLGVHKIRAAFSKINDRLPVHLRIPKATGHTGRHSFTSAGVNAGADVDVVALATKQKSSNALKRYVHREDSIKVLPALKIAKSVFDDVHGEISEVGEEKENEV
jgi:integrase